MDCLRLTGLSTHVTQTMLCGLKYLNDFYETIDSNGRTYRLDNLVALLGTGTKDRVKKICNTSAIKVS